MSMDLGHGHAWRFKNWQVINIYHGGRSRYYTRIFFSIRDSVFQPRIAFGRAGCKDQTLSVSSTHYLIPSISSRRWPLSPGHLHLLHTPYSVRTSDSPHAPRRLAACNLPLLSVPSTILTSPDSLETRQFYCSFSDLWYSQNA